MKHSPVNMHWTKIPGVAHAIEKGLTTKVTNYRLMRPSKRKNDPNKTCTCQQMSQLQQPCDFTFAFYPSTMVFEARFQNRFAKSVKILHHNTNDQSRDIWDYIRVSNQAVLG